MKNLAEDEIIKRIKSTRPDAIEIASLGDSQHFYVCFSKSENLTEISEKLIGSIFREKELRTMSEQTQQQPSMKAWYDQLLPYIPSFVEQLLGIISRMIGVQINTATTQMKADIAAMKAEALKQMQVETEAIRKQQEQMLKDFDSKISEKTASLGLILNALAQAGASLQQVKK
jgi:hypothetical protein